MTGMESALLARIEYLENRLAIQDLRHRYWLAIVERDLDTMIGCYSENAHSQFGFGMEFTGRDALRGFYRQMMSDPELAAQIPFGTNGLVTVTDDNHASGSWLISVVYLKKDAQHGARNNVRYHETYVKTGEGWKIASQIVDYLCFEQITPAERPNR
jgi:ketosteroid isomerase-like protein